jgi:DNA-binding transcriptional regulator YiaG
MSIQVPPEIEIPDLSPEEFTFIRRNSGVTMKMFARYVGKLSRSSICAWEHQKKMKPYQVKLLMEALPEDLFKACRKLFAKEKENKKRR